MNIFNYFKKNLQVTLFSLVWILLLGINFNAYSAAAPVAEDSGDESSDSDSPFRKTDTYREPLPELTEKEKILVLLTKDGNIEVVKKLLEDKDLDINVMGPMLKKRHVTSMYESEDGFTPLMLACKYGHTEIVKLLLSDDRIDVNLTVPDDNNGDLENLGMRSVELTAAYIAAIHGQKEILQLILEHPEFEFSEICRCLLDLIKLGKYDIAKFILSKVDINTLENELDHNITTIFSIANWATAEELTLLQFLLINTKLDVNVKYDGYTPLIAVARGGIVESPEPTHALAIMSLLTSVPGIDLNAQDTEEDNTALHWAYRNEDLNMIKHLLTFNRIDLNIKNRAGRSIIELATADNNSEVLELISNHYAQKQATAEKLFAAIKSGNESLVRSVILRLPLNVYNEDGDTPLHAAIKANSLEIIKLLLNAEPKLLELPNKITKEVPLATAMECEHINTELITKLFLGSYKAAYMADSQNITPIDKFAIKPLDLFTMISLALNPSARDRWIAEHTVPATKKEEKTEVIKALIKLGSVATASASSSAATSSTATSSSGTTEGQIAAAKKS